MPPNCQSLTEKKTQLFIGGTEKGAEGVQINVARAVLTGIVDIEVKMAPEKRDLAVHEAFDRVRDFLTYLHTPFSFAALNEVEEAMANNEPLSEHEEDTWRTVIRTINAAQEGDNFEVQNRAAHLRDEFLELIGPFTSTVPSMLRWYQDDSSVHRIALIAVDVRGKAMAAVRPINVTSAAAHVDMGNVSALGGGEGTATIQQRDFAWTVFRDSGSKINAMDIFENTPPIALTIPPEYRYDERFGLDSSADTALILRSALEELKLIGTKAVLSQDVHLFDIPQASTPSETSFFGFGARRLPPEEWIELMDVPPSFKMKGILNEEITPEIARTALRNLERIYYTLKEAGIAMTSWNEVVINRRTGEVFLSDGDLPVLVNTDLLEKALANPEAFLRSVYERDSWPHFPNLVVVGRFRNLIKGDAQLATIVQLLADKGGVELGTDIEGHVQRIVDNFRLLAEFKDDPVLRESVTDFQKLRTIRVIAKNYIDALGTNGMLNFFSFVMKEIVMRVKHEKWISAAASLIEEAIISGEANVDKFWAKNRERIMTMNEEGKIENGGGSSPSNPPPDGIINPDVGVNSPPKAGQAKGSTVTGTFETNEVSGGGTMRFPGALSTTHMRVAAHQQTDVAGRRIPYHHNLAVWSAMRVFAPAVRGTIPILN